jgi:protein-tyrosine-phosphatase
MPRHTPGLRRINWEFPDPKTLPLNEVRAIREQIRQHVQQLIRSLDAGP